MPPRNSITKPFKRYEKSSNNELWKTGVTIPMGVIYEKILKPKQVMNNTYLESFEEYKRNKIKYKDPISSSFDKMLKADDEGDPRYINRDWYRNRAKGLSDDGKEL